MGCGPLGWKQLVKLIDGVLWNSGEHIPEPIKRIDVIDFAGS